MSETQEDTAPAAETDPNFSISQLVQNINGKACNITKVTYGNPVRTISTRELSLGDEFNLIGVAGDLSNNTKWMVLAGLAWSATDIDGVACATPTTQRQIQAVLDRIGTAGLSAYLKAAGTLATTREGTLEAAKN